MKLSNYFLPTLRQAPQDADNISAKLMFRAGMIRKLAGGIYEWLPLGMKVLKKVENIIREEMNRAGAQEVWLPVIQPKNLWVETGRWFVYGKELLRMKDRKDSEFCFAPTAEEVITDIVRRDVNSYRQLPLCLYQFGAKFRDEIRPRFGVMRAREFYMKDAYSFHANDEDCERYYGVMREAYARIFRRCGFTFTPVEADSGPIGGSLSHEFMVMAETGEDRIALCENCGYAANAEKAESSDAGLSADKSGFAELKDVPTPGLYTVDDVSKLLKIPARRFIKTMFYLADGEPVLALVRGDHELNENKLRKFLNAENLEKATESVYENISGCKAGFAGPVDIKDKFTNAPGAKPLRKVVADFALKGVLNGVSGANKEDYHSVNINIGRDYEPDEFADLHLAVEGDLCPKCARAMKFSRGIEVGQIFKLGTKYSKSLKCDFLDENQKSVSMVMGCFGIGVSRIVAASIEQSHDDHGIIWPPRIAPFEISLVSVETEDAEVMSESGKIYDAVHKSGLEALWDERNERAGVKFKDADLIGLPWRIVVSKKTLADGECEFKPRAGKSAGVAVAGKPERWKLHEVAGKLKELRAGIK